MGSIFSNNRRKRNLQRERRIARRVAAGSAASAAGKTPAAGAMHVDGAPLATAATKTRGKHNSVVAARPVNKKKTKLVRKRAALARELAEALASKGKGDGVVAGKDAMDTDA